MACQPLGYIVQTKEAWYSFARYEYVFAMANITIGLGSNLGDRLLELTRGRTALAATFNLVRCSPIYETAPWGVIDQPHFLNAVCQGSTDLEPHAVLAVLKQIEHDLGRVAGPRWGPRAIDLDLLLYDDLQLETPTLTLPHPRLHERAFVLVPLAGIAPTLRHPRLAATIADLRARLDTSDVQLAALQWPL